MESRISDHGQSLAHMRHELSMLASTLTVDAATKRSEEISRALETGTERLYMLSVLIRGDFVFDQSDLRLKAALDQLVSAFTQITELADNQLAEVGRLNSDSIELRNAKLRPLQDGIEECKSEIGAQLEGNQQAIMTTSNTVDGLQHSINAMNNSLRSLQDKLGEAERVRDGWNIAISVLIPVWGIVGLIDENASPGAVFQLRDAVNNVRNDLHNKRRSLEQAMEGLAAAREQQAHLEHQAWRLRNMQTEIEDLGNEVTCIIEKTDALQRATVAVKQQLTVAAQHAAELSNTVLVTAHQSFTKQEFCSGILDIAEQVPLDPRNSTEMTLLLNELLSGYGSTNVPAAIESRANGLLGEAAKYQSLEWNPNMHGCWLGLTIHDDYDRQAAPSGTNPVDKPQVFPWTGSSNYKR
ncbi:hypothetical protein A9Z42_0056520 [Trichoderma parareesei]|uniref:Uncharacterized protein n=1 Tax=Trichoderma parareesei TaxID=858221 RepID=A0A2H2ZSK5_TRIPA|nr:hypothetical protein A9Z42_0056520 [Trichoderma parareesei]